MNIEQFTAGLQAKGITLTQKQLEQFERYYELLVEWNEKMNLTAITAKLDVYLKHFFDSITAAFFFDFSKELSIIDVGAGAGFPSLPLKICFPHLQISIVDSLNKRITFLDTLAKELQLDHIALHHDRAETFAQNLQHREKYDIAMARAVARLNILAELCIPMVKKEGFFLAMKGLKGDEELIEAQKSIHTMGGEVDKIYSFHLPQEEGERNLITIKKIKASPKKYPRKPGIPSKQPIK